MELRAQAMAEKNNRRARLAALYPAVEKYNGVDPAFADLI